MATQTKKTTTNAAAKKTVAKRKPATKASVKRTAAKPASKRTAVAKAVSKVAATPKTIYLVDKGAPYGCYHSDDLKGAYTQAMQVLCQISTYTPEGRVQPVKANPETMARRVATWGKFVQNTAYKHWRKTRGLIDMNGLTREGINESQARLAGTSKAFRTNVGMVDTMIRLLTKGGTLQHKGHTYKFAIKADFEV